MPGRGRLSRHGRRPALNGNASNNNNYANATPAALQAATGNVVLSSTIQSSQVAIDIGRYVYVPANLRFEGQFPGPSTENWSMARATISTNIGTQLPFAKVFSFAGVNLQAVATAAHRPRDIAIVLDYSGSMRYASLLGEPTSGNRSSNNPDSVFPTFGHYSATSTAALQATSFTSPTDPANITTTTSDGRAPRSSRIFIPIRVARGHFIRPRPVTRRRPAATTT